MKKSKYIILFSAFALMLSGCTGGEARTLSCKTDQESLGNQEVTMDFNESDVLENMTMKMTMDYGVEFSDEDLDSLCAEYNTGEEGVSCTSVSEGTKITVEVVYDITKMSDEAKAEVVSEGEGYDLVKEQFMDLEYTCE